MSLTEIFLAGNNSIIPRESDIPAGDGKIDHIFYSVFCRLYHVLRADAPWDGWRDDRVRTLPPLDGRPFCPGTRTGPEAGVLVRKLSQLIPLS